MRMGMALAARVARLLGRRAQLFLSLCGPAIVISLIAWWAILLTLGAALIFHPYLGSAIKISDGPTPTDFVSATYAAANSMSIVGSSSFSPQTATFRLIFMFNSFIGMSVISLTLTFLTQIYSALQQRNAFGLHLFLLSGMTGSGAEMLVRIAPQGRLDSGLSTLSDLASDVVRLKEMHHFYPVLLYFRFEEVHYSISFATSIVLDCVSLIESAIDTKKYDWLQSSGALAELWSGSHLLLDLTQRVFDPAKSRDTKQRTIEDDDVEQWRQHYLQSLDIFKSVGIQPAPDVEEGAANTFSYARNGPIKSAYSPGPCFFRWRK